MERNEWLYFLFCGGVTLMEQTNNIQRDASITNSWASMSPFRIFVFCATDFYLGNGTSDWIFVCVSINPNLK